MFDLYLFDLEEGEARRLTSDPATSENEPTWSPDGLRLAFTTHFFDGSGNSDIFLMDRMGQNRIQLTHTDLPETFPAWSPSGDRIAFLSKDEATEPSLWLHIMTADGSSRSILSDLPARGPVSWSPDGSRIAFATPKDDSKAPYIFDVDAREGEFLTDTPEPHHTAPAWSPDGRFIAFSSGNEGQFGLSTIELSSGIVEQVTDNPGPGFDSYPLWAPAE